MKKGVCVALVLALACLIGCVPALAQEQPVLAAQSAVLADLDTGAVLFEQNAYERCAPASLTKIMTVLLAVEAIEAGEVSRVEYVTAPDDVRAGMDDDSSSVGIQPGEQLRMEDLLYCAMLSSANESCNAIAWRIAGSVEAFAEKMNERAQELGCTDTHFVNPNGLSADDHYSTAHDLLLIAREAMSHPLFAEICAAAEYTVAPTNLSGKRELVNTNALLSADGMYGEGYEYEGTLGVKTGYTSEAGYCLVSAVERDGVRLLAVVLGCAGGSGSGYGSFSESIALYDWAFDTFRQTLVLDSSQCVWTGRIAFGSGEAALYPVEDLYLLLPEGEDAPEAEITVETDGVAAPLAVGTQLGTARVSYGGASVSVALQTRSPVARSEGRWAVHRLVTSVWFWVVAALAALAAAYVVSQRIAAKKRRRRRIAAAANRAGGGKHLH